MVSIGSSEQWIWLTLCSLDKVKFCYFKNVIFKDIFMLNISWHLHIVPHTHWKYIEICSFLSFDLIGFKATYFQAMVWCHQTNQWNHPSPDHLDQCSSSSSLYLQCHIYGDTGLQWDWCMMICDDHYRSYPVMPLPNIIQYHIKYANIRGRTSQIPDGWLTASLQYSDNSTALE